MEPSRLVKCWLNWIQRNNAILCIYFTKQVMHTATFFRVSPTFFPICGLYWNLDRIRSNNNKPLLCICVQFAYTWVNSDQTICFHITKILFFIIVWDSKYQITIRVAQTLKKIFGLHNVAHINIIQSIFFFICGVRDSNPTLHILCIVLTN
jgi:hypothetical protein